LVSHTVTAQFISLAHSYIAHSPFLVLISKDSSMIQKRKREELVESMDDYPTNKASGYPHSGIWHEIESLAEQDRTLVYLYYIYGFSQKEISAILNIPTGTVKSRLYTVRQKLKNCR